MTIAEIHRKVSEKWTNSEDVLTSDVFTAFRYLPADKGIVGFLRSIYGLSSIIPEPIVSASCEFHFWPRGRYREPDLMLEITVDGHVYHVLIEAKYLSGPSDYEIVESAQDGDTIKLGNQLADQLRGLHRGSYTIFHEGDRYKQLLMSSRKEDRLLLYLTAHPVRPDYELAQVKILYPEGTFALFWANWYQVYDYLTTGKDNFSTFPYNRIVADVLTLLKIKHFSTFQGITPVPDFNQTKIEHGFWIGTRILLPSFTGIRPPPAIDLGSTRAPFWKGNGYEQ